MTPISQESNVLKLHLKTNIFMQKHFCSMLIDQNIVICVYPKYLFLLTPKGGWCVFLASVKKNRFDWFQSKLRYKRYTAAKMPEIKMSISLSWIAKWIQFTTSQNEIFKEQILNKITSIPPPPSTPPFWVAFRVLETLPDFTTRCQEESGEMQ